MEKIFHISPKGDIKAGYFGTLFECAAWVQQREGAEGDLDESDPIESLHDLLGFDPDTKYELDSAEAVIPLLLSIEESMRLRSLPAGIKVSEIPEWIVGDHENSTLKDMVDVLHGRTSSVRWRGSVHSVGSSPFTQQAYEALLIQLS